MRRMISSKAQKYIKDLATNHPDPSAEWGGAEYTAGTGIDISEGEINIDDTVVATKTDLEDYELKESVTIEYTKCPQDYLDPDTQDVNAATAAWLADMPIILASGSATEATLRSAGHKNIIPKLTNGTKLKFKGYFGFVSENSSNIFDHINYFCTDAGTSASTNLFIRHPEAQFYGFKNSGSQLVLNACRTRMLNTSLSTKVDLFNNSINVIGLSNNLWSTVSLTSKLNTASNGFEAEGISIYGNNVEVGANIANQLKTPTTAGTYLLSTDVNPITFIPTFAWYKQPIFARVATTGDYDDLTNKPTIPDAVSGTNDGTNWTNLTIGNDTYAIPQGGGSSYTFTNGLTESNGTVSMDLMNDGYKHIDQYGYTTINLGKYGENINIVNNHDYSNSSYSLLLSRQEGIKLSKKYNGTDYGIFFNKNSYDSNTDYQFRLYAYNVGLSLQSGFEVTNQALTYNHIDSLSSKHEVLNVTDSQVKYKTDKMTLDSNGNMSLAGSITATNIPAVPTTTDGTYVLKATVSNSVITYAWVLES